MSQNTDTLVVPADVAGFVRAMVEWQGSDFDVVYFLEKPWKWDDEYARWKTSGKPVDDTDDGWAAFSNDD